MATNTTYQTKPALFGPSLSNSDKVGYLLQPLEDPTGCQLVTTPFANWIALVKRGSCSVATKVRNMQQSGAVAVAIGDLELKSSWFTMYALGDTFDIEIPSIFLARNEYKSLLYLSELTDAPLMILLQRDQRMDWPLLDAMIIVFVSPSVMLVIIYIFRQLKQQMHRDGLTETTLASLVLWQFTTQEEYGAEACCAICLEDYFQGEMLRLLPCHHGYHAKCVDAWLLTKKGFCPICRRHVVMKFDTIV
ncbi:hypothetical protein G6F22_001805 [Rhizopus arrhizus]|nr:hypothetical protein G6F22_001805 [Rhizopus arrhizus]